MNTGHATDLTYHLCILDSPPTHTHRELRIKGKYQKEGISVVINAENHVLVFNELT